jgi:hypothetical protein
VEDLKNVDSKKGSMDSTKKLNSLKKNDSKKEFLEEERNNVICKTEGEVSSRMVTLKSKPTSTKQSPSPENKIIKNTYKSGQSSKSSSAKGLNVIPIKPLNSNRENMTGTGYYSNNADKIATPKLKDGKIPIPNSNQNSKNKLIPITTRNPTSNNNQNIFDKAKYSNKTHENIFLNLKHKSPSPKHTEIPKFTMKHKI